MPANQVELKPPPPSRRSIRLAEYDYAIAGSYFVTIGIDGQTRVLGQVRRGQTKLSQLGEIAKRSWQEIPEHFPSVMLDEFVIMPNHLHGIIVQWGDAGTACRAPTDRREAAVSFAPLVKEGQTQERFSQPVRGSLPTIVRSFKSAVTKTAREQGLWGRWPLWQRGYYEHIIRRAEPLDEIRRYIRENPNRWMERHETM